MQRFGTTIIIFFLFVISTSFYANSNSKHNFYLVIDKSEYELIVYKDDDWIIAYPVVFGSDDLGDKMMQGDRKTPEGTFAITTKRKHDKWNKIMMLDYPTKESYVKFNQRKAAGIIPANAKIGGSIAIHGTWPHDDYMIDQYRNWTLGCISMKNEHLDELFKVLPAGAKVIIRE